ncbi:MAG TPA: hypothetical protein VKH81_07540 [Candidatus Angelobacter sp.]|nr:hypothetical protein [Candidatus Angelobacter sp.]
MSTYEALAISEVLALAAEHPNAHVVIAPDVNRVRAKIIQQHHPTFAPKPNATVADIVWELSRLWPSSSVTQ